MKSFIILCGGKSRRMGRDKGSMNIDGKPMIIHVIETLTSIADEIVLVLRDDNQVDYYKEIIDTFNFNEKVKLNICTDILNDQGPLAGILTGLQCIKSDKAMVIPCDSPFISEFFVNKMFSYSVDPNFDAFIPKWSDGNLEPLHSIYRKNIESIILKLLNEDIRDVKGLLKKLKVKYIDTKSLDASGKSFFNINRMDDIPKIG
jgi:molybdopterin-guanine dinucleotide biosynthesis protein A